MPNGKLYKIRKYIKYHHRLLHLRFAPCVYSFVAIGALLSPTFYLDRLLWTFLALFLGLQMGAYKLDELKGRHMMTKIPDWQLKVMAVSGLTGSLMIGLYLAYLYSPWILLFTFLGGFFMVTYNLELFKGLFHNQLAFAFSWASLGLLGSNYLHSMTITPSALVAALAAFVFAYSHDPLVAITKCWCKPTCLQLKEASERGISSTEIPCRMQTCNDRLFRDPLVDRFAWKTIKIQNPWLPMLLAVFIAIWRFWK